MKLSFSTVGCPDWSFDEIFAAAKDFGYDAIEIRGIENEIYAPKLSIFSDFNIAATIEKFKSSGLFISMLASNAVIGMPTIAETGRREAIEYIELAGELGVPFVRILISPRPEADPVDMDCAASVYSQLCDYAKGLGVTPLLETNGAFAKSCALADFMRTIQSENKGVLWDINHPCRFFGESAKQTFENIGGLVKYLHIKDSTANPQTKKIEYKMVGHGDLPIFEILQLMAGSGYSGALSLEWTKRWQPDLEEPGIVFGQYISYMQYFLGSLGT